MSIEKFNHFKDRFMATKPIRGRAVDTRPIGKRARDWETVVKSYIVDEGALDVEGGEVYGAHLYQTDCVMYTARGDMYIRTGGYETPTTAEFINRYIPRNMECYKKYNKIWVAYKGDNYVMNHNKAVVFRYSHLTDTYAVENPIQLQQKVIDKAKMKVARDKIKGFRDYAKIMLKLADGWISNELIEQHAIGQADYYGRKGFELDGTTYDRYKLSNSISESTAQTLYNAMASGDETLYPKLLCMICAGSNYQESRVVRTETYQSTDYHGNPSTRTRDIREEKFDHKSVDNRITHYIKTACDVFTTREVALGVVATNCL